MWHVIRPREKKCGSAAFALSMMRKALSDHENRRPSTRAAEPAPIDAVSQPLLQRQRVLRLREHRGPALDGLVRLLLPQVLGVARRSPHRKLLAVELDMELHRKLVRAKRERLVRARGAGGEQFGAGGQLERL